MILGSFVVSHIFGSHDKTFMVPEISADPDQILQKAAFNKGLHFLHMTNGYFSLK